MDKQGLKEIKRNHQYLILKELFLHDSTTMAELIEATGLSQASVRNMVRFFQEKDMIIEKGNNHSTGGRCATRFALKKENYKILCLYIQNQALYYQLKVYDEVKSFGQLKQDLESITMFIKKNHVHCCVVAVEGIVKGNQYITDHKDSFKTHTWIEELSQKIKVPVYLENDVKAMHLGYSYQEKRQNSVYLHMNQRGVGMSYIHNEYSLSGLHGLSGEIGLLPYKTSSLNHSLRTCSYQTEFNELVAYLMIMIITMVDPLCISISLDIKWVFEKNEILALIQKSIPFTLSTEIKYQENFDELLYKGLTCFAIENLMRKQIRELK